MITPDETRIRSLKEATVGAGFQRRHTRSDQRATRRLVPARTAAWQRSVSGPTTSPTPQLCAGSPASPHGAQSRFGHTHWPFVHRAPVVPPQQPAQLGGSLGHAELSGSDASAARTSNDASSVAGASVTMPIGRSGPVASLASAPMTALSDETAASDKAMGLAEQPTRRTRDWQAKRLQPTAGDAGSMIVSPTSSLPRCEWECLSPNAEDGTV